jgi:hypothetical protein
MTNSPPPSRSDWKAMRVPSGEKAGMRSRAPSPPVSGIGLAPPKRWM